MKLTFTGYTKDGQVFFRNQKNISKEIIQSGWAEFDVTIEKRKKNRSVWQNRWLWICIGLLSEHTGYSKEEMLSIVKFKFLKSSKRDEKTGEVYEYLKGTSELTTVEFSVFMEDLIRWSAESLQVILPYPNEQLSII